MAGGRVSPHRRLLDPKNEVTRQEVDINFLFALFSVVGCIAWIKSSLSLLLCSRSLSFGLISNSHHYRGVLLLLLLLLLLL